MKLMHLNISNKFRTVVLALFLTGCFAVSTVANSIKVGINLDQSSTARNIGNQVLAGASAYINYINEKGGVSGQQLELIIRDDSYDALTALKNSILFIEDDNVDLLFSYVGTAPVTRVLPLLKVHDDKQLYMLFPITGAEPQRDQPYLPYAYNFRASYFQETAALVDYFVSKKKPKIAVFYQADAYGRNGWEGVRKRLAFHGLSIHEESLYTRGATLHSNFDQQAAKIAASQPDAVIVVGSYGPAAGFIKAFRKMGNTQAVANLSFAGSETVLNALEQLSAQDNADYTNEVYQSEVVPDFNDQSLPASREYKRLMAKYYPNQQKTPVSFEGFLNAKLLVSILQKVPAPFTKEKLASVLKSNHKYDIGIYRGLQFSKHTHQASRDVYLKKIDSGSWINLQSWRAN